VFHYLKRTTEDFDVSDDDNKRERVAGRTKDPRSVALALMLGIVSLIVAVLEVGLVPAPAWEKAIGLVVAVALAAVAVGVYLRA
jgi:high-affinity K+ transport system ATPase subunit B